MRRVLLLMLPVTLSLGLININLLVNSFFGTLVSDEAPAAIDKAFRIYMLPQGIFSVAVSTVLFPTLARYAARGALDDLRATMANGMRQIILLLTPAAAAILVLSEPMIRLVYQRGEFSAAQTDLVATALFWFAFSLPFNGLFLLLTRTFFSLQRPWVPTAISAVNLAITALFSLLLYDPFGVGGIVAATAIATAVSVVAQAVVLRRALGRLELGRFAWTAITGRCSHPRPSPRRASESGTSSIRLSGAGSEARSSRSASPCSPGRPSTGSRSPCCGSPRRARSGTWCRSAAADARRSRRPGGRGAGKCEVCELGHTTVARGAGEG